MISSPTRWRWRGLALLAGLLLPCAFAPYGLWLCAPLAFALLLVCLRQQTPRAASAIGFCFGLGMFAHGVWWIQVSVHQFGVPFYVFSVGVTALFVSGMALYVAVFGFLLQWIPARTRTERELLCAPALWVVLEWLRGWLFTGFPWLGLGYSQIDGPFAAFAPLAGVSGCSLAVAYLGAVGVRLLDGDWRVRAVLIGSLLALLAGARVLAERDWTELAQPALEAALVQAAIAQSIKWEPEARAHSIELYTELTARHWDVDVVVWPETAVPAFPQEVPEVLVELSRAARAGGSTLLTGIPTGEPWQGRYFNSVQAVGASEGRYDKRHLVPFGEFFPFKAVLHDVARLLHIPLSDFSVGAELQPAIRVAGHVVGVSICYEDAFAREIRRALPAAAFLVNVSNDAWFGDTIAPHQHLEIARMRALESGRWMLRATNSGISALIDHQGRVRGEIAQFEPGVLRTEFDARRGATPYVRFGELPLGVLIAALMGWVAVRARRRPGSAVR